MLLVKGIVSLWKKYFSSNHRLKQQLSIHPLVSACTKFCYIKESKALILPNIKTHFYLYCLWLGSIWAIQKLIRHTPWYYFGFFSVLENLICLEMIILRFLFVKMYSIQHFVFHCQYFFSPRNNFCSFAPQTFLSNKCFYFYWRFYPPFQKSILPFCS